jgi:preprotein translocase subunit Sec61beta
MQLRAVPTHEIDPRLAVSVGAGIELILILPR